MQRGKNRKYDDANDKEVNEEARDQITKHNQMHTLKVKVRRPDGPRGSLRGISLLHIQSRASATQHTLYYRHIYNN